jgi:hypothetical protein
LKRFGNEKRLSLDFRSFYIEPTEGEVNHEDGVTNHPTSLGFLYYELIGIIPTNRNVVQSKRSSFHVSMLSLVVL